MAAPQLDNVLRHIHRAVGRPCADDLADGELLRQFVAGRDEAAFTALVRRHAPMVWGVCRRVLSNEADAEDAFQATFLVLVRKADSVAAADLVGNWLYGVACRVAARAKADAARRRTRQTEVPDMPAADTGEELTRRELRPVLDEELSRLPERYRAPLVLCYLQGKSYEEAARLLGCPAGTVSGRLARARRLLRGRLARRGLACSAAALAAVTGSTVAGPVPQALLGETIRTALRSAVAFSTRVTALAEGVIGAMWTAKTKTVTGVVLALCLLGGGATLWPRAAALEPGGPVTPPGKEATAGIPAKARPGLHDLWADLASSDEFRAARALLALGSSAKETVALFKERLGPVKADAGRVARLLADLDSRQLAVRTRAAEALEYLDKYVKKDLEKALKATPSEETRRRLQQLLGRLTPKAPPAGLPGNAGDYERLRALNTTLLYTPVTFPPLGQGSTSVPQPFGITGNGFRPLGYTFGMGNGFSNLNTSNPYLINGFQPFSVYGPALGSAPAPAPPAAAVPKRPPASWVRAARAVAVLEHIGSPEARDLLRAIAGGEAEALPTREARAALERLSRTVPAP